MSAPTYATRVEANRANSQFSTGPRTEAGKATVATNAVRHGLTANLQRLDPRDSPSYQQHLADLTTGLCPATPVEEFVIRDLAMLKARLDRLEAAEYAAIMSATEGNPDEASAYLATAPTLATLEKTERFLRRNYMQTWSRLERMQKERKQAAKDAQRETTGAAPEITRTKQSHPDSTNSKQAPTTHPAAPTPTLDTAPPSPKSGAIEEAQANAA